MLYKLNKIIAVCFIVLCLLVGLLSIYRDTLSYSHMNIVEGEVLDKKITSASSRHGRTYGLAFTVISNQKISRFAIKLGTKSEADKDSAIYLIDTGKIYRFYIDPTIPVSNGINWGVRKIDYKGIEICNRKPDPLNLYGGITITILCTLGLIAILKYKKKEQV